MDPRSDSWPDRLHTLWRSAFGALSTRQLARELYTGLLSLPGVRAVFGVRVGADGRVQVTRWADATGLQSGPPGLAEEVCGLVSALTSGDPIRHLTLAEVTDLSPGLAERLAAAGLLVVAFDAAERGQGVLGIAVDEPRPEVTTALAQATEVVIAADHRIGEQRVLEDRQALDALLAEASLRMDASLDIADTLRAVLRMVVPALADGAAIHIRQDGGMAPIAAAHVDAQRERLLTEHLAAGRWAGQALVDGADRSGLDDEARPAGLPPEVGLDTMTIGVLRARGRDVGLLTFFHRRGSGRRNSTRLLRDLASRAALAIDNATLYEQRRHDVVSLQQHLLPAVLPEVPGVELAAGYNAADHTMEVGGDFYGVVDQPGGTVIALVGDVCGRGAPAAALTGLARHTLETVLAEGGSPRHALGTLNAKMLRNRISRFLTIATATLGPVEPDGLRLETLAAGHPAPLLVRREGTVHECGCTGRLVGVLADLRLRSAVDLLRPGDLVVLFSDGLIEARDPDGGFFGDSELARTLGELRALPTARLVDALLTGSDRYHVNDDVAVLAIRYLGPPVLDRALPSAEVTDAVTAAVRALNPDLPPPEELLAFLAEHPGEIRATVTGDARWARIDLTDANGDQAWTELVA
ncbi:SpoIIE family protein phosphatase [Actinokineospora auranticolor]|uniref:Serine phosphatase RsbU (Regulator of sigma subunit) n=1 Tax=Actinokineospora auranticolor TaxID=155976 RepID=A0A2S6H1Q2_9PSEU|nr:SpoIIE family protein phosphatase [Actinokineospora auranticolor]PPK71402.1 serine phosphatase RsbU (regulator of sigma subunit) [Actinokineospora auranticolor]